MQKEIYIFRAASSESYKDFTKRMFELAELMLEQLAPSTLKASMTTRSRPLISVIPFKRDKIAVFSLTDRKKNDTGFLAEIAGFSGGYLVEEAIPVHYHKTWEDGGPTPGVCLLTLFHRKPDLDYGVFVKRWHEGHTPLSLKLHPLWNYIRNVVKGTITNQAPWYDGIVEEQFQEDSH